MRASRGWRRLGRGGLVLLVVVYCLFPIYFVLVQSLKSAEEDIFGNPLIVLHPTFENFEELFVPSGKPRSFVGTVLRRNYPFFVWLENTIVVFTGTIVITLLIAVAAAYALGRLRPPGFRWWRRVIFATYVIPQTILFVPLYQPATNIAFNPKTVSVPENVRGPRFRSQTILDMEVLP